MLHTEVWRRSCFPTLCYTLSPKTQQCFTEQVTMSYDVPLKVLPLASTCSPFFTGLRERVGNNIRNRSHDVSSSLVSYFPLKIFIQVKFGYEREKELHIWYSANLFRMFEQWTKSTQCLGGVFCLRNYCT